jgi:hypothetical protein
MPSLAIAAEVAESWMAMDSGSVGLEPESGLLGVAAAPTDQLRRIDGLPAALVEIGDARWRVAGVGPGEGWCPGQLAEPSNWEALTAIADQRFKNGLSTR